MGYSECIPNNFSISNCTSFADSICCAREIERSYCYRFYICYFRNVIFFLRNTLLSLRDAIREQWLAKNSETENADEDVLLTNAANDRSSVDDFEICEEKEVPVKRPVVTYPVIQSNVCQPDKSAPNDHVPVDNSEPLRKEDRTTRRYSSRYSCYGVIDIKACDIACLDDGNWLNDVIVDFYMEHLLETFMENHFSKRIFCLSSLASSAVQCFHRRACGSENAIRDPYKTFEPFTKNVDLFSKDFVLFPLSLSFHWILVIICYPDWLDLQCGLRLFPDRKSCILMFDSFGTSTHSSITAQRLRYLLESEWKAKKVPLGRELPPFDSLSIPARSMKVPLQQNSSDCGLFVLHYAEMFLKCLSEGHKFSLSEFCRSDLREWFPPADIERKRSEIRNLVLKLPTKTKRHLMVYTFPWPDRVRLFLLITKITVLPPGYFWCLIVLSIKFNNENYLLVGGNS
ncbi:Peptidase C48 domain containing protein [Trichuris trichiura]|uniref:Peptidase C48 domain containing protein n=1 Tax=Trichuris trichiura TaxID=36087 RepID=A0A077ZHP5_TRITR|nr:Peptidase C48 domain containing protein [Trichuris trichiura]